MAAPLTRPTEGRMIAGVCAGLARRFGISSTAMRIIFLASCLLPGPQFLIYLGMWLLIPQDGSERAARTRTADSW